MCTGLEFLALAGAGSSLAGGAVGAAGSLSAGAMGNELADLQAQIALGNSRLLKKVAKIQEGQADLARTKAGFEAGKVAAKTEAVIGGQTAYFGANDIDVSFGSPLFLASATAAQGELDRQLVIAQGELERAEFLARAASTYGGAASATGQAAAYDLQGEQAKIAGYFGAATAILGGVGKAASGLSTGAIAPSGAAGQPLVISSYGAQPGNPFRLT